MAAPFCIKQGAVLSLALQFVQDDGTPVDITGATLQSQIRDQQGNLIATPTLTIANATLGQVTLAATSDDTWPLGTLNTDIYYDSGGTPFFTDTFTIAVAAPITVPS